MSDKPLVSVLIPAYNHAAFIARTLQAVREQTYPHMELLVHDDGSSDQTRQVLERELPACRAVFQRVEFSSAPNQGSCRTLNLLIGKAKGEYLYLTASDDYPEPSAIEKEVSFLQNHPDYVLAVGDCRFIDQDGRPCGWDKDQNVTRDKNKTAYRTFAEFLSKQKKLNFSSPSFGSYASLYTGNYIPNGYLWRKAAADKIGPFTPQAPLEDFWMMLQLAKIGKMKFLPEVLFSYRQHEHNQIKNKARMDALTHKTRRYEETLLEKLSKQNALPAAVQRVFQEGVLRYKRGIPGLLTFSKYVKFSGERMEIRLFGVKIFTKYKAN